MLIFGQCCTPESILQTRSFGSLSPVQASACLIVLSIPNFAIKVGMDRAIRQATATKLLDIFFHHKQYSVYSATFPGDYDKQQLINNIRNDNDTRHRKTNVTRDDQVACRHCYHNYCNTSIVSYRHGCSTNNWVFCL